MGAPAKALSPIALLALGVLAPTFAGAATSDPAGFVLTTTAYAGANLKPAFVGNGYLGARVPFDGQGYREAQATQAQVQGLFGKSRLRATLPEVESRASLPVWASLDYDDGSGAFALDKGRVEQYRQSLDLHTSTLSTDIAWVSPGGHRVALHYDVLPDRARPHAALVRLRFTPEFAGRVTVTDAIDPGTGKLVRATATGTGSASQYVDLTTDGLGVSATLASTLSAPQGVPTRASAAPKDGVAQQVALEVLPGRTYEVLKTVGVAVAGEAGDAAPPHDRAIAAAKAEARLGYDGAKSGSDAAWDALWAGDIQVTGDPDLQLTLRAALFALFASARDDGAWAPSPGGLSTDGYLGHVFWDSETWMFPVYLAVAPQIARQSLEYRIARLPAAEALAKQGGYEGARFPWESALSGDEVVPIPAFGHELHISGDVALAAWQSWLATGERSWLEHIYPTLAGIADFWVSYATPNADGSRSLRNVVPPDEDVLARGRAGGSSIFSGGGAFVDDSAYTNEAARRSLQIAQDAARRLGRAPNPAWADTARTLRRPAQGPGGVVAEYAGYGGDPIKQADVTLLAYPWAALTSPADVLSNLEYYAPRTNPDGPSMTDAIHSILASQIGAPGCSAYSFTRRSIDPFVRPPYRQLAEARGGGAFTFATGAGGLLQEFLYGYTGLRWRADALWFDPALPPQLGGVTLPALHWRGRVLRVEVKPQATVVRLLSGPAMRVVSPRGTATLSAGRPVTLATRLTARAAMARAAGNVALCRTVMDSDPGSTPAVAVNDGLAATAWMGPKAGQSLTIDLGRKIALRDVTISRPPAIALKGGSDIVGRFGRPALIGPQQSAGEDVAVSTDGKAWTPIGRIAVAGPKDVIGATGQAARYVRIIAFDATPARPLTVGDVTVRERRHPDRRGASGEASTGARRLVRPGGL